jgi:uncharacterized SAM-binding protein YcdF (DUF218 family)
LTAGLRPTRARPLWIGLGLIAVAILLATAVPLWRHGLLRAAGWLLVAADPIGRADIIVIAVDAEREGVLDAADLVKAGVASRVVVFSDPPHLAYDELARRGVAIFTTADLAIQRLHALGVSEVDQIPSPVTGSEDESRMLPAWCLTRGFHTIIFVSAPDHSRRIRRAMGRTARGLGLKVIVRPSHFSDFDPDAWWLSRAGTRTEIVELQKLLLDCLRHPFS